MYMQQTPVNLVSILRHAAQLHPQQEVVSKTEEGEIHRYGYRDAYQRTQRLASALADFGLRPGERVATLAWNHYRHLEAWYAIFGQGAICHTLNPRLFPEQLVWIMNHAEDRLLFVDLSLLPVVEKILPRLPHLEALILMNDSKHMPTGSFPKPLLCYEELLEGGAPHFDWPLLEEDTPALLCYTSGTTGHPKGVLYTHRSNLLHALALVSPAAVGLNCDMTLLMIVPMFHANGWGAPYGAPMVGSKLVMPGPHLGGAAIHGLIEAEQVTHSMAVPTLWNMLLGHLEESGGRLDSLREVLIGGAAAPAAMIEQFWKEYEVRVLHAWGMTELSPLGTVNRPVPALAGLPAEERAAIAAKQGRPVFGIELRIADEEGATLPADGSSAGRLMARGPWVLERYYGEEEAAVDAEGWLDTGDIATLDEYGYMQITDRAKDVIKSGGEWISSVQLENLVAGHPAVELAAVIGVADEKWGERPLLLVKKRPQEELLGEELVEFLRDKVVQWWLPDRVEFLEEIPLNATGKVDKRKLRERYG